MKLQMEENFATYKNVMVTTITVMMMIGNTVVLIRNHHHLVKRRVRALKFLYMLLASVRTGHLVLKGFFHSSNKDRIWKHSIHN